jgi:hypothetical protein
MDINEMHTAFKQGVDKQTSLSGGSSYEQEEIDFWLNQGIRKFVTTRYTGTNVKGESFEQTQKRIDDLRPLVEETRLTTTLLSGTADKPNSYTAALPSDYWYTIGEEAYIAYSHRCDSVAVATGSLVTGNVYHVTGNVDHNAITYTTGDVFVAVNANFTDNTGSSVVTYYPAKRQGVKETTADTYRLLIDDPLSEHILHYYDARPLRMFNDTNVELVTDGQYNIIYYYLRYLKEPTRVNILTNSGATGAINIDEGITYSVSVNSVTYNTVTYTVGQTFVGVFGVTSFTGAGTVTMVAANTELPDHTHDELIRVSVNMALENIEQPRYQTHTVEVSTME